MRISNLNAPVAQGWKSIRSIERREHGTLDITFCAMRNGHEPKLQVLTLTQAELAKIIEAAAK